jgi:hypothetical protein
MTDDFWLKFWGIAFLVMLLAAWFWKRINEMGG